MNKRLKKLQEIGQSVWVASLSRDDIQNGNLQRMMADGVLGVTSNPAIFQQAIAQSELYGKELLEEAGADLVVRNLDDVSLNALAEGRLEHVSVR